MRVSYDDDTLDQVSGATIPLRGISREAVARA